MVLDCHRLLWASHIADPHVTPPPKQPLPPKHQGLSHPRVINPISLDVWPQTTLAIPCAPLFNHGSLAHCATNSEMEQAATHIPYGDPPDGTVWRRPDDLPRHPQFYRTNQTWTGKEKGQPRTFSWSWTLVKKNKFARNFGDARAERAGRERLRYTCSPHPKKNSFTFHHV